MALNTKPIKDNILARLRNGQPNVVYNSEAPEDASLPATNGIFAPYIAVYFSSPVRASGDRHIVSNRHDTNIMSCTVQVCAPTADIADTIVDQVVNLLAGHRPPDAGEMALAGGLGYTRNAGSNELPTVYVREAGLTMRCNLSWAV